MKRLLTLIVDDEPLARRRIRQLLESVDGYALAGESRCGEEAVAAIRQERPDLVFLDIQMPDLNGFQVLERLRPSERPECIFVTAYEEYALRAFEVHAVDYLLKPFDDERFLQALQRARQRLEQGRPSRTAVESLARFYRQGTDGLPAEHHAGGHRLLVKSGHRTLFVDPFDIRWMAAEGSYVRLHCGGGSYLLRRTLSSLYRSLRPRGFIRIHRSTVVNKAFVREVRHRSHGDYDVILYDKTCLKASRNFRHRLLERLTGR